jgi:hypothetical protein
MDVAENLDDACLVKHPALGLAVGVAEQIERRGGGGTTENIVGEFIPVGEFHRVTLGNHDEIGDERVIALGDGVRSIAVIERIEIGTGFEIDDRAGEIGFFDVEVGLGLGLPAKGIAGGFRGSVAGREVGSGSEPNTTCTASRMVVTNVIAI